MAVDLTLRLVKGTELTFAEIDNNWQLLDHAIDSLDDKVDSMTLGGLRDVDTRYVEKDDYLQWNGREWVPEPVILPRTTDFQGTIDVTLDSAPTVRSAGDAYLNIGSGIADASWYGLVGPIDSSALIVWSSEQAQWYSWGGELPGVVVVRPGSGISIDNIDPKQPIVNNLCDSAYIQLQIDSINTILQNNIDSVHDKLIDLTAIVNANFDSIDGALNNLQINIDSVNSSLIGHVADINADINTINGSIGTINNNISNINADINQLQTDVGGITVTNYTAGNGLQLAGPQFSMTGSFTGNFGATGSLNAGTTIDAGGIITGVDRLQVNGTTLDGAGNAHVWFKDGVGRDRAVVYSAISPTHPKGSFEIQMRDPSGNQGVLSSVFDKGTMLRHAGVESIVTQSWGLQVYGKVNARDGYTQTRMSVLSDSVSDSGRGTPLITAVDLGRAFRRLRTSVQSVSTFDSLQSNLDSALNAMQQSYEAFAGVDSVPEEELDSIGTQ